MKKDKLSSQQEKFCQNIVKGMNQTDAYREAGYKISNTKTINEASSRLARNVKVKSRIAELQSKIEKETVKKTSWDNVRALKEWEEMYNLCKIGQAIETDKGSMTKAEYNNAIKALENISRHIGFYEKDKQNIDVNFCHLLEEVSGKREIN